MNSIYKTHILELYSEKPNFGKLKDKTHTVSHKNPLCNDEITIELKIKDNKIINAKFHGISCFVSTVSASALLNKIKGMTIDEIKKLSKKYIDNLLGIEITHTRAKCELLPLEALKKL